MRHGSWASEGPTRGRGVASLVSKWLVAGDFTNCFTNRPPAVAIPEPTVVRERGFERISRGSGEERGVATVRVYVVRAVEADADAVAGAAERWLRSCAWDRDGESWPWRVVDVDTTVPHVEERDSSGRYVWSFDVMVTVVRELGEKA